MVVRKNFAPTLLLYIKKMCIFVDRNVIINENGI